MWLAMKLVVAQFCRTKDHKIINEGAECVQSENASAVMLIVALMLVLFGNDMVSRVAPPFFSLYTEWYGEL